MSQRGWRKWHRWVGFVAAPFVLYAAITGVIAGASESLGEDEAAREAARDRISTIVIPAPATSVSEPISRVFQEAASRAPGSPIDKITIDFKSEPTNVILFLGKPDGGEDRKLFYDANTGAFLREERYEDKPFLTRLHSGEALGDWGLVFSMAWGVALVVVTISGLVIYMAMHRPGRTGLSKIFW